MEAGRRPRLPKVLLSGFQEIGQVPVRLCRPLPLPTGDVMYLSLFNYPCTLLLECFMKSGVPGEGGKGRNQGQSGGIGRGGPGVNPD